MNLYNLPLSLYRGSDAEISKFATRIATHGDIDQ